MEATPDAAAAWSLLTFAPMIDCELSRLVLTRYGVPYREEPHIFGWASVLALWHAGTVQIPVLYGRDPVLVGPRAMVDHFEADCPVDRRLLPASPPLRGEVEADWTQFNGDLSAAVAAVAYFLLLPHRDLMIESFSRGIPAGEASVLPTLYPLLRGAFTLLLQLSAAKTKDALDRIRTVFDHTDARVADGRRYLVGDALTLSDLSLAAGAAPLLLPDGYTVPIPTFDHMPPAMVEIITELRQRPTAHFIQRIFTEHAPPENPAFRQP